MEANIFYLAILHFLNENGGSCSVEKLKENLPFLRDYIMKGQPELGEMDCDSCWEQILKSSNNLSKQGHIVKKSGTWHISVKGLKFLNDNNDNRVGKKEKISIATFFKNIPNIWKVIMAVLTIIIAYLTFQVGYLNYIETKRSNEIAIQEREEQQAKYIAERQPLFQIEHGRKFVKNKFDKGYYNPIFGDTIFYDTLVINNVGTPIKELHYIHIFSFLQLLNEEEFGRIIILRSAYTPFPKWFEWEYTSNKTGKLYEANSYEKYWELTYLSLITAQESINDSTKYYLQVKDFIIISYTDIMDNHQIKTYCDDKEITKDNFDKILDLYAGEGKNCVVPNPALGDCSLERVKTSYPNNISFQQLKDSLMYINPPERRVLDGMPKFSKIEF